MGFHHEDQPESPKGSLSQLTWLGIGFFVVVVLGWTLKCRWTCALCLFHTLEVAVNQV